VLHLEDNHEDIIAKAMRGRKIGKTALADSSGLEKADIENLLKGNFTEDSILRISPQLKLDGQKLLISAKKLWIPKKKKITGLKQFESSFGSMIVNSYILYDLSSKVAWVFDTGTDCKSLLSFIKDQGLKVDAIFLTHSHRDHISCIDEILKFTEFPKVYVHSSEKIHGAITIDEGFEEALPNFRLKALHTHGHSVGGITYVVNGLGQDIAIVGDAIFAGSMGGGMVSYEDALMTNREKIMTLPDETILCPGHGPITTVGEEKKYNPFFPEF